MTDDEFNQFITLLDAACASDDPKIKKALKKFMFLVRLNISDDEMEEGPFTKMMETIDGLQRRVAQLEQLENKNNTYTNADWTHNSTSSPNWIYNDGTTASTTTFGGTFTTPLTTPATPTLGVTLGGSCTGFTSPTSYVINSEDSAPKGTEIKNEVKARLKDLLA